MATTRARVGATTRRASVASGGKRKKQGPGRGTLVSKDADQAQHRKERDDEEGASERATHSLVVVKVQSFKGLQLKCTPLEDF
jgi:hypothetical protein